MRKHEDCEDNGCQICHHRDHSTCEEMGCDCQLLEAEAMHNMSPREIAGWIKARNEEVD